MSTDVVDLSSYLQTLGAILLGSGSKLSGKAGLERCSFTILVSQINPCSMADSKSTLMSE